MPKQRILFLMPSLVEGGAERVLINLLKAFDYSLYDVELCVVLKKGVYFDEIPSHVKVITLLKSEFLCRVLTFLYKKFNFQLVFRLLARFKIKSRYEAGVSFLDSSFTDILFFLNDRIERKITWVHSSYKSYSNFNKFYQGNYKSRIIANRYSRLDTIIFVSDDSMQEFIEVFGSYPDMRVLYNILGVKTLLAKADQPMNEPFNKNIANIIAMGSLFPVKGYDKLIYAARMLKEDNLKFKIRILGSGYLKDALLDLINKEGLNDYVELLGFKHNPYPYLKGSDIFVMTSVSEALPTALCEAMILGLPTVVTDCSGCREIVGSGEFGVMTPLSEAGIYQGLKEIINNPDRKAYFKKKSLERSALFNDDQILKQVYEILNNNINSQ